MYFIVRKTRVLRNQDTMKLVQVAVKSYIFETETDAKQALEFFKFHAPSNSAWSASEYELEKVEEELDAGTVEG